MPQLEAGSVDAIITDLPYGTTACAWDVVIPLDEMWKQVKRVLKPSGVFVTTSAQPFTSFLVVSNPNDYRCEWIFEKTVATNFLNSNQLPMKAHENVIVFSSSGTFTYNPQRTSDKANRERTIFRDKLFREGVYGSPKRTDSLLDKSRLPRTVQLFKSPPRNNQFVDKYNLHPTQKAIEAIIYLVKTYTNFGETVLDIAMGSGTTIEAAIKTGRKSIGIERDPKYFAIAEKRIKQAAQQPALLHEAQQSVQRTGGESGQQNLFSAGEVLPAKVTAKSPRR